ILEELGAADKPILMVFNKIDQLMNENCLERFQTEFPHSVGISARDGTGIPELLSELGAALRPIREFVELRVPHNASSVIARLHQVAQVVERDYEGEEAKFKARIPPHLHAEFARFVVQDLQKV